MKQRALVLGSGGLTGIAWQSGVLAGLAESGVDLAADRVIGTSAGAVVGARLTTGWGPEQLAAAVPTEPMPERLRATALAALLAAQAFPSRRHALAWLGRRAARAWTPAAEAAWVERFAPGLAGRPWPANLVIVATDATTGRPAFLSHDHPADLARAVAASCAIPGVFPAVRLDGRLHFDGGLRSPLNLDVAAGAASVIALAPLAGSLRAHRRPSAQAAALARDAAVILLRPDAASRRLMGTSVLAVGRLAAIVTAGREQGRRVGLGLGGAWPEPAPGGPRAGAGVPATAGDQ